METVLVKIGRGRFRAFLGEQTLGVVERHERTKDWIGVYAGANLFTPRLSSPKAAALRLAEYRRARQA